MRLLITGYPGWLTNRFLETLQEYPEYASKITHVRCLSLNPTPLPPLNMTAENVVGHLLDSASLKKAVSGMDFVLHAAGVLHVKRNREFYLINRDGTENLLQACEESGIKRFVYISSNAAQGFCAGRGFELSESDPCKPESHYGKSKREAELLVEKYDAQGSFETVILRPAMFYGPPVPERHLAIYRRIQNGNFPVFGTGDYLRSITYIDHLVQGIHLALNKPAARGQTYYIADRVIPTLNEIILTIADSLKVKTRIDHYPAWLALFAEKLDKMIAATGLYWMLPHIVGESCKNIACSIIKAEKELGYHPTLSFKEAYPQTIAWCRERQLL